MRETEKPGRVFRELAGNLMGNFQETIAVVSVVSYEFLSWSLCNRVNLLDSFSVSPHIREGYARAEERP
jgi:hypothetical protein